MLLLFDLLGPNFHPTNVYLACFIIDSFSFLCSASDKLPIARPRRVLAKTPFSELPLVLLLTIFCVSGARTEAIRNNTYDFFKSYLDSMHFLTSGNVLSSWQ